MKDPSWNEIEGRKNQGKKVISEEELRKGGCIGGRNRKERGKEG